jgi:NAD(P)H dehydrogenase (quinone)
MRVLVVHAHPVGSSFNEPVPHDGRDGCKATATRSMRLDLYRDGFDPVMSEAERLNYHDLEINRRRSRTMWKGC